MKRSTLLILLLFVAALGCSAPPAPEPVVAPQPAAPADLGTGRVTATALNVRAAASTDAEVLTLVRRGEALTLLEERDGWYHIRLGSGQTGWASARYISRGDEMPRPQPRRRSGCPPDSDFAFEKSPLPSFSDRGAHGLVIVEAHVNTNGVVTSTKVVSNSTGDETLAFLAEREIREARFIPPVRNCVKRSFIFTYKRAF